MGLNAGIFCLSDGYLFHGEPYCGRGTDLSEAGVEQGSDVVHDMTEKCVLTKVSTVAMDSLFTTLPLLDKLTDTGRQGLGTIRENQPEGAPLKKKPGLLKETRGTFYYTSERNNLLVAWRDSKVVIVATNYLLLNLVSSTRLWSKAEKKHVDVSIPNPFKEYNANMEDNDLFDQCVSTYHVRIRSKKVVVIFFWLVNKCNISDCLGIILQNPWK